MSGPFETPAPTRGTAREVFALFLGLGLTSFGGPIAHLGYFRETFVIRRKWLDERAYADLIALCQFLPGPASSQVGFSIGLMRAGYFGGLAAWAGFTLPSAIALMAFAYGSGLMQGDIGAGALHGLKLVAVAIVAQALFGMARNFCPDRTRASIAAIATLIVLLVPTTLGQIATILFGAGAGLVALRGLPIAPSQNSPIATPVTQRAGLAALIIFLGLLALLPVVMGMTHAQAVALFDAFYRSGALVFGGGHVVLPLLHDGVVAKGFVNDDAFLAGYGAAQAVPGPLFTFAAFLGFVSQPPPHGIVGALIALFAIFLPGILILVAALPFWEEFRSRRGALIIMSGVNAAVVGLIAAALYDPIFVTSVKTRGDFALAFSGFMLLTQWRAPPLLIVLLGAACGAALASL